jgi:hypothetical protein
MFNYYKIINIAVVFGPSTSQVNQPAFLVQMNWNSDNDILYIKNEDNTKTVPVYRTRNYILKFLPVNMDYLVGEPDANPPKLSVINPSKYIRSYIPSNYIPGRIVFDKTVSSFTEQVRILIRVQYRGSKLPGADELNRVAEASRQREGGIKRYKELSEVGFSECNDNNSDLDTK